MQIEFDITLTPKDMYRFNMYQTYTGFHGWFSILISILIFVVAGLTRGDVEPMYTIIYVLFGVIFLFYMPVTLLLRSKHSLASSDVLSRPLHYAVGEEGFVVSQGDAAAELPWDGIYKMTATKNNVLVYSNRTNAYVIPREQIREQFEALAGLAEKKLPGYRLKIK